MAYTLLQAGYFTGQKWQDIKWSQQKCIQYCHQRRE